MAAQVKDILDKEVVRSVSLDLKGGAYKILNPDDTGSFQAEHETVSLYGSVIITSEEKEAPKASSESAGMKSYIDTSYSLAQSRRDPRTLGYIPLLLAGIISAFYLAFSIPYWYFVHQGRTQVFTFISELLTEQDIFIHLCAVLAALLLTILAMAVKSRFWTFLAMLAYAFSAGWPVYVTKNPWYLLPGAVLAFFCLVAFVRKRG